MLKKRFFKSTLKLHVIQTSFFLYLSWNLAEKKKMYFPMDSHMQKDRKLWHNLWYHSRGSLFNSKALCIIINGCKSLFRYLSKRGVQKQSSNMSLMCVLILDTYCTISPGLLLCGYWRSLRCIKLSGQNLSLGLWMCITSLHC